MRALSLNQQLILSKIFGKMTNLVTIKYQHNKWNLPVSVQGSL